MRIIFYTGKGGTGKSVISCATGVKAAEQGKKVLVISTDPAHTLSDIFEKRVFDKPTEIIPNLWALQVDPIREVREKYGVIQDYVASIFQSRGLDEALAYEIASLPNMTPFISLLKIYDLVNEGFDALILDTVPSGEALKNLYLPMLLTDISKKFLKTFGFFLGALVKAVSPAVKVPAPSKEVIDADLALIDRLEVVRDLLTNVKITSLRLIANPDFFSIENLRRTYMVANLYNVNVDLAIINKVIPEEVSDPFFSEWKEKQAEYLVEAEKAFYPLPVRKVPLFKSELKGINLLKKLADYVFQDDDPLKVFYEGKPLRVDISEDGLQATLIVKTPFAKKEALEVERFGDELMVKVDTNIGEVRNFIPLPAVLYSMKLEKAKLIGDELHITFVKR
ncbi:MAG: hypothetical protein DRJ31_07540 [Candidatus Methanomethylicota archaeon]|nr:MAG: hypothetical protein DRJ31_07540 [Candidatus Verstraetearchaeota archaeon]